MRSLKGNAEHALGTRFATGQPIPEQVTPRELLDLRRGFNEEHGRWNPELHEPTVAAGRRAYGGLTGEFHRVLPEAEPLDTRISNLIPVKNRAQITALGDNPMQKVLGRVGAHTGAATLGIGGALEGRREGGTPGMIVGGLTGLVAPELIASPEGQMIAARALNKAGALRPVVGGAAQVIKRKRGREMILLCILALVFLRIIYCAGEIICERDWPRNTMRGLVTALFLLVLGLSAFGQAVRVDIPLLTSGPNVSINGTPLPTALWLSNATIQI